MENQNLDLNEVTFDYIKPYLVDILADLSSEIYLKEHRVRYQAEQTLRLKSSVKCFKSFFYRPSSVASFALDYNKYLWKTIYKSHGGLDPKIQINFQGNYPEKNSYVDKLVYYLYFQNSAFKKYLASVLAAAYKNPLKMTRNNII